MTVERHSDPANERSLTSFAFLLFSFLPSYNHWGMLRGACYDVIRMLSVVNILPGRILLKGSNITLIQPLSA